MTPPPALFVGLMSGTSLDGVDAALVDLSRAVPQLSHTVWLPYPDDLREDILALHTPGQDELHRAAMLGQRLAHLYAEAVAGVLARAGRTAAEITAIGCHGQTVRHRPERGYTLQINAPALLAELTGIDVVADFRSRDIAAGGQGAPLVPAFHAAVFAHPETHRVILNIGGIANLTRLSPGHDVCGFDCGPGNLLLDAWIAKHQGKSFDTNGEWAASGKVLGKLLDRLLEHPFFHGPPPKSCGREEFNLYWLSERLEGNENPADVQATLLALTATSIRHALEDFCPGADELYVCGGGAHNHALLADLSHRLPKVRVRTTEELGLPADWVEAVAFAWLAWRTTTGQPGNLPAVTGAAGPRRLGGIYPA